MGLRPSGGPLRARLRLLDPNSGRIVAEAPLVASKAPPDGDQAVAPHLGERWLWQPTRTAVHRVDPDTLQAVEVLSHPLFHDVHSIAPGVRGWLVTCTGHESVVEIDLDGIVHERWSLGAPVEAERDYRGLAHDALKPHAVHPNRAFLLRGRRWVTCLGRSACVGLGHGGSWELGPGMPHDGILREGLVWFTTTEGQVLALDPVDGSERVRLDVAALEGATGAFGWCRGIEVRGDRLWVGVTVLRSAAWKETARALVRGAAGRREPTRVLEVDWRRPRITGRWEVGERGEGTIYGVTAIA